MVVTIRSHWITNVIKLLILYLQGDPNKKSWVNVISLILIGPCNLPKEKDLNYSPEEIHDNDGKLTNQMSLW